MYCVYWMQEWFDELSPTHQMFDDITKALSWCNELRDNGYKFVTMVSEVEGNVTKMGATGMDAKDYEWKMRR